MRLLTATSLGFALALACGARISRAADAITVSEYVQMKSEMAKDSSHVLIIYLSGVADALHSVNTVLAAQGNAPFYCANLSAPLSATQLIQATDHFLAQTIRQGKAPAGDMPISVVAANAVSIEFRCK
jgi:hypothetical protein